MRMTAEERVASRWIPKNSTKIDAPEIDAVVYLYNDPRPCAVGYTGTKSKHDFHHAYRTKEGRLADLNKWRQGMTKVQGLKEERKANRNQPHSLKNGAIFLFTWGYEQTNLDFYQVVDSTPYTVTVREIAQESNGGGYGSMSDHRIPTLGKFIGEPMRKRVQFTGDRPYLTMASYGWCGLWDGKPHYCSWYG